MLLLLFNKVYFEAMASADFGARLRATKKAVAPATRTSAAMANYSARAVLLV